MRRQTEAAVPQRESTIGNAATNAAVRAGFVVGAAGDRCEAKADDFAATALARVGGEVRRSARRGAPGGAIGAEGGELDAASSASLRSQLGGGRPLESGVAAQMRAAGAGHAGQVRVHDDDRSDRLARTMSANAFTLGNDVFFARGGYRPDTAEGYRTLAHEVAHAGDTSSVRREVIHRDVGFEFETSVVVRKEEEKKEFKPLAKMEKIAKIGALSIEADENSTVGSTIEFVIEHVKEDDRKTLEKALDEMEDIAKKLAGEEPKLTDKQERKIKGEKGYKQMEGELNKGNIKGSELFAYEQERKNKVLYDNRDLPLASTVIPGAKAKVRFAPKPDHLVTANPQVTAGISASKMHSVLASKGDNADPGAAWLMSGNSAKSMTVVADSVKDLKVGTNDASPELKGLAAQLVSYLKNGTGASLMNYAKLISGAIMARTDFSQQFRMLPEAEKKTFHQDQGKTFRDVILGAAGMAGTDADKVFARGVRSSMYAKNPGYTQRLQSLEGITRGGWLTGIVRGFDALSGSQAKLTGEDALAGQLEGMGRLGTKTDRVGDDNKKENEKRPGTGVVVEFRGMSMDLHYSKWKENALAAFDYIVSMNSGA